MLNSTGQNTNYLQELGEEQEAKERASPSQRGFCTHGKVFKLVRQSWSVTDHHRSWLAFCCN